MVGVFNAGVDVALSVFDEVEPVDAIVCEEVAR